MQLLNDPGDIAICGLIAMLLAGAGLFSTRVAYEYFELANRPSRVDKLMIWTIAGMNSLLLFAVLLRK